MSGCCGAGLHDTRHSFMTQKSQATLVQSLRLHGTRDRPLTKTTRASGQHCMWCDVLFITLHAPEIPPLTKARRQTPAAAEARAHCLVASSARKLYSASGHQRVLAGWCRDGQVPTRTRCATLGALPLIVLPRRDGVRPTVHSSQDIVLCRSFERVCA